MSVAARSATEPSRPWRVRSTAAAALALLLALPTGQSLAQKTKLAPEAPHDPDRRRSDASPGRTTIDFDICSKVRGARGVRDTDAPAAESNAPPPDESMVILRRLCVLNLLPPLPG